MLELIAHLNLEILLTYSVLLISFAALLLGAAAGAVGSYFFVSRQALLSDAMAHATLPGLCLAFLLMSALGLDGRWLPGLMLGAALSSWLGVVLVNKMSQQPLFDQQSAIAVVLSVFFGFGIVLLTLIQALPSGARAGLEGYLLGSIIGMRPLDVLSLALLALVILLIISLNHRKFTLLTFDRSYAQALGLNFALYQGLLTFLILAIVVLGLRYVGAILVVAILIIPPASARLWVTSMTALVRLSALFGAIAALFGVLLSALIAGAPTGALIVLVNFSLFFFSLLFSRKSGIIRAMREKHSLAQRVHLRQGLLAMARSEAIYDALTCKILIKRGYMRKDGLATERGLHTARKAVLDEQRLAIARKILVSTEQASALNNLKPIESILTKDTIALIDQQLRKETEQKQAQEQVSIKG